MEDLEVNPNPCVSFVYQFSTNKILLPNYVDVYQHNKSGIYERLENNPRVTIENLNHELMHKWLNENIDKATSLQYDNVDKGYNEQGEFYILSAI
jgi:hypothetical protein